MNAANDTRNHLGSNLPSTYYDDQGTPEDYSAEGFVTLRRQRLQKRRPVQPEPAPIVDPDPVDEPDPVYDADAAADPADITPSTADHDQDTDPVAIATDDPEEGVGAEEPAACAADDDLDAGTQPLHRSTELVGPVLQLPPEAAWFELADTDQFPAISRDDAFGPDLDTTTRPTVRERGRTLAASARARVAMLPRPQITSRRLRAAGAVAALIAVAAILWAIVGGEGGAQKTAHPPARAEMSGAPSPSAPPAPGGDCPSTSSGPVTTGRDAGNTSSGANAIKAFDYAYYQQRSGAAARLVADPDGHIGSAQSMQQAIDALPVGTTHCLRITDMGNGLFAVQLTTQSPGGGAPVTIRQLIQTTTTPDGRTLLQSIQQ